MKKSGEKRTFFWYKKRFSGRVEFQVFENEWISSQLRIDTGPGVVTAAFALNPVDFIVGYQPRLRIHGHTHVRHYHNDTICIYKW